jgi:hypothetical protein
MQKKKISLAKYLPILTVNNVSELTARATTMAKMWDSVEPSFIRIKKELGEKVVKSIIATELGKMVDLLKADMQKEHVLYMVNYILQHYYSYTISDLTVLTDRLVKNNPYGKPIMQNLIYELDQYSIDKQEYAVDQHIKETNQHKHNTINQDVNNKILKIYDKMKAKAREPQPTQKQKDQAAQDANTEKIKELQRLYPQSKMNHG